MPEVAPDGAVKTINPQLFQRCALGLGIIAALEWGAAIAAAIAAAMTGFPDILAGLAIALAVASTLGAIHLGQRAGLARLDQRMDRLVDTVVGLADKVERILVEVGGDDEPELPPGVAAKIYQLGKQSRERGTAN